MAPTDRPTSPPRPVAGAGDGDWATQVADTIEKAVTTARTKTVDPLQRVARVLVYGLLAAVVGVAALVLVAVAAVRVLDVAIPGNVWSAHLVTGGIFVLAGLFLWKKRTTRVAQA